MDLTLSPTMPQYLYQSSISLELAVVLLLLVLVPFPRYLVGLVVALTFLRLNERFPMSLPLVVFAYIFLSISALIHFRKVRAYRLGKDDWALLLFVALVLLETLLFNRGDLPWILKDFLLSLAYYFAIVIFLRDEKGFRILNSTLMASTVLICLEPLYYHLTEPQGSIILQLFTGHEGRLAAWGLWRNANETSFLALLGIATIFIQLSTTKARWSRFVLYAPLLAMFLLVTVKTASRAGIGAVCILLFFTALFNRYKTAKVVAIALLIACAIAAPMYLGMRTDTEGSSEARENLRYVGKHIFLDNPVFGCGYGQAPYGHGTGGQPLHNTFLQAFAETGFFGGFLVLSFVFLNGRDRVNDLRMNRQNKDVIMLNSTLLGLFAASCAYFLYGNQLLSIMFLTIFALLKTASSYPNLVTRGVGEDKSVRAAPRKRVPSVALQ